MASNGWAASTRSASTPACSTRVNAICPGWVDTPFNDPVVSRVGGREAQAELVARTVPLQRQGTPADMAPMFVFLVSDESAYVTSQALLVDGGLVG